MSVTHHCECQRIIHSFINAIVAVGFLSLYVLLILNNTYQKNSVEGKKAAFFFGILKSIYLILLCSLAQTGPSKPRCSPSVFCCIIHLTAYKQ